jgi:hypothetical protein
MDCWDLPYVSRKYNGGEWTVARYNSFVTSALRAASRRWPPKYQCLNDACVGPQINLKTGRMAKHYTCNECRCAYPAKDVQVDHVSAIIDPAVGFTSWDEKIDRLFCEKENLQVLCKPCHELKSNAEKQIAKERKNAK